MPRRSVRLGGYGLTVEVPEGFGGALLRRMRGRRNGAAPAERPAEGVQGRGYVLRFVEPPAVNLTSRDARAAIAPWTAAAPEEPDDLSLAERVRRHHWYHTIDLGDGLVTSGEFDHRALVPRYGLPDDLTGQTALDIASYDGFWAFELERRGAAVTSVDVDRIARYDHPGPARALMEREGIDPPHRPGFDLAREALGSKVERTIIPTIYALDPDQHGTYDFVHIADVLLHLESPTRALRAVRSVTRRRALIVDAYDPTLGACEEGRQLVAYYGGWDIVVWWIPSISTLAQMVLDAGFTSVRVESAYYLSRTGESEGLYRAVLVADV